MQQVFGWIVMSWHTSDSEKMWKTGRPMFFILTGLSHYLFVWGAVGFVVLVFRKGLLQCYNVTIDCWFWVWLGVNSPCYS